MGINYYYERVSVCPTCGRERKSQLHIGKSSAGWVFVLHVIPEEELNSLDDWEALWNRPGGQIRDESGVYVSAKGMQQIIRERSCLNSLHPLHRDSDSSKHGPGTWDLEPCDFS